MADWLPRDKVCVVGIGESVYYRWGRSPVSEFRLALDAIMAAVDDAGLKVEDLDGFSAFAGDRNDPISLVTALGIPRLRFSNMFWGGGGGGGSGAVMNAVQAVASGSANYVVAYRSLAQGQFGRIGQSRAAGAVGGTAAFTAPFGLLVPAQNYALRIRRHMSLYGTTSRHLGAISVACYKHAQRNPRAVMHGRPINIEDHQSSRMIADPFHLYDCCQENDGAAAVILTSAERARDLKHPPVYVMATSQGTGSRPAAGAHNIDNYATAGFTEVAQDLYARAGVGPEDIDVAQIYENFTGQTLMSIEDHGFCKRGEGGAFVEGGRLEWPDGDLPLNTSGGNLAEAYIHGFELVNEAVRQMRGTSTCQVKDAEICLVASGPGASPFSDMIVRR